MICQAISQDTVKPRRLQKSETLPIANVFTIVANGNNIRITDDLVRRVLWCLMDAWQDEKDVQSRTFTSDPVEVVLSDRGKYIAACLTILRAHALAKYEGAKGLTPFIGFDDWSKVVRGALVWLGKADPVKSLDVGRDEDPERNAQLAFIEALYAVNVDSEAKALTVAQMSETLHQPSHKTLKEALQDYIDVTGNLNATNVGKWFAQFKGRMFGRKRLLSIPAGKGRQKWFVHEVPFSGPSLFSGITRAGAGDLAELAPPGPNSPLLPEY